MSAGKTGTGARLAFAALAALIVALAAVPARAVEWETYLSDDFNGADSMFYTGQAGEAYYSLDAGRYIIDGMNTGVDSLSALTDNLYYYYVEAQCELLDSTAGELAFSGVVFHYNKKIQGKLSYYVFYAYGDGYYGAKRVIGDQVEIVLPLARSEMLDAGRPNILGVDCQGTRFDLYINGRYVDGFTDVRVDGGGCGFYVSKFSKAAFDSFAVKVEHRGGSVIPPEAPLTVEGSGPSSNGAEASPPGIAPDNSTPAGTQESGHSFLGYKAPVIPKDPNRPVYPWEVGVDKTGKGNKNTTTGGDGGSGLGASGSGVGDSAPQPARDTVAPAVAPPGSNSAAQTQHPASQATPEQAASKLSPANPPTDTNTSIPPGVRGDLPHQSIRDAGEPGELPQNATTAASQSGTAQNQQLPVLPEGEVLLPDDTSNYARPNPPEQTQIGTSDVALVPAGEADELASQQAANSGAGEAESPSALGNANPASAAGNVLKRVRTSESSQPKPDLLHATKTSTASTEKEPVADPPAQPEAQPDTGVKEAVLPPANDLDPAPETAPAAEPETAETAQARSGDELPLFGDSSGARAKPATDTAPQAQPAVDTTPELKPEAAVASNTAEPEPPSPGAPRPDVAQASAYFSGAGAVQIADDFTQQTWPVSESGPSTYRYFGAAYEVDNLAADTMAISFQEAALADCELTIAAEFLDGASYVGYGAAARFSVDEAGVSYYGLFISRSGEFLLLKVVDGVETVLKDWTASTLINPSLANKVTLEVVGKRLTAYVNGTAVASVQDASLTAGGYALLAGPGVKVRYDDLLIRGYPAK